MSSCASLMVTMTNPATSGATDVAITPVNSRLAANAPEFATLLETMQVETMQAESSDTSRTDADSISGKKALTKLDEEDDEENKAQDETVATGRNSFVFPVINEVLATVDVTTDPKDLTGEPLNVTQSREAQAGSAELPNVPLTNSDPISTKDVSGTERPDTHLENAFQLPSSAEAPSAIEPEQLRPAPKVGTDAGGNCLQKQKTTTPINVLYVAPKIDRLQPSRTVLSQSAVSEAKTLPIPTDVPDAKVSSNKSSERQSLENVVTTKIADVVITEPSKPEASIHGTVRDVTDAMNLGHESKQEMKRPLTKEQVSTPATIVSTRDVEALKGATSDLRKATTSSNIEHVVPDPAPTSPVTLHAERLAERLAGPELRFGWKSADSGSVQVSTVLHDRVVEIGIAAERTETATALRAELPVLEGQLREHALRLGEVNITAGSSLTSHMEMGGQRRGQQEWRQQMPAQMVMEFGFTESDATRIQKNYQSGGSISLLA